MKPNYRITYVGNKGNNLVHYDIYAENKDDAFRQAYRRPEASNRRFEEVSVEKIPTEPSVIGIEFLYTDTAFKKDFHGYINIRAESEAQAVEYYNKHFKGTRFWFSDSKIEPDGKCIRKDVVDTFFSGAFGYAADATKEELC